VPPVDGAPPSAMRLTLGKVLLLHDGRSAISPTARRRLDGAAFAALGFGVSWTLADCIVTNFPVFVRCLPGGLYLPDQVGLAATSSQAVTLAAWWLYTRLRGVPTYRGYCRLIWACIAAEVAGAALVALAWRATLGGVAVVVIGVDAIGAAVGTLSWAVTVPFISAYYAEELISAFWTGSTSGSLAAGLLGLAQGAYPGFGPRAFLGTVCAAVCGSAAAWSYILAHCERVDRAAARGGAASAGSASLAWVDEPPRARDAPADAAAPQQAGTPPKAAVAAALPKRATRGRAPPVEVASAVVHPDAEAALSPPASPPPPRESGVESATAAGSARGALSLEQRKRPPGRASGLACLRCVPPWVRLTWVTWVMAVPLNMSTWGFSPNIVNFAAAHAGCSCDPHVPAVASTYRFALSLGYMVMPLAAYASYLRPTHDLRALGAASAVQAVAFGLELCAAGNAGFMACSAAARATLVGCIVTMRATDTYVTAMLFRVVAKRTAARPAEQQAATLTFGTLLVLSTLGAGLLAVLLVHAEAIGCWDADFDGAPDAGGALAPPGAPPLPLVPLPVNATLVCTHGHYR
jgi:hypothetical protein